MAARAHRPGDQALGAAARLDPMEIFVERLIEWFALPRNGLSSVFLIAFVSATLLPLGSEPAVFGYAKLNPDQFWIVVLVATVGNTLGGVVDYWMGRGAKAAVAQPGGQQRRLFERGFARNVVDLRGQDAFQVLGGHTRRAPVQVRRRHSRARGCPHGLIGRAVGLLAPLLDSF